MNRLKGLSSFYCRHNLVFFPQRIPPGQNHYFRENFIQLSFFVLILLKFANTCQNVFLKYKVDIGRFL